MFVVSLHNELLKSQPLGRQLIKPCENYKIIPFQYIDFLMHLTLQNTKEIITRKK